MNALATVDLPISLSADLAAAKQFIRERHSMSTRRAYAGDVVEFKAWCDAHGLEALPASPEVVALFISAQARSGKKASTVRRRLAAIRHLHREAGHPSPTQSETVAAAMSGIRRAVGTAARQVAPATADVVREMISSCGVDLRGKRDRALLALGFGGAFRRSELVALEVADLEMATDGIRVHLRKSKTDQEGIGRVVPVLDGRRLRVKEAVADWLETAGITEGPIFRGVLKSGEVAKDAITDRHVANIIKARAKAAGLDPAAFAGHSLRAGFLTTAAQKGASLFKMMEVSGHKKLDTLQTYVRMAAEFTDHAGENFM